MFHVPSLSSQPSLEFFHEQYSAHAQGYPTKTDASPDIADNGGRIVYRDDVLKALRDHDEKGMAPVERQIRAKFHPDQASKIQHTTRDANLAKKLRAALEKYDRGREQYLWTDVSPEKFQSGNSGKYDQGREQYLWSDGLLEELQSGNPDLKQVSQISTMFHYDLQDEQGNQIPYNFDDMGDIFYHPLTDVVSNQKYRQVPKDFKDTDTAVGAIHAYFRDFGISDPKVRKSVIDMYLKSTPIERQQLQGLRSYIKQVLKENPEINTAQDAIVQCMLVEKSEYHHGLGFRKAGLEEKAQDRVKEFFESANPVQIYRLQNYIEDACAKHPDKSLDEIIGAAEEARLAANTVVNPELGEDPQFRNDVEFEDDPRMDDDIEFDSDMGSV